MDSKVWSLQEWNSALVTAVFLNPSRPRTTLSRIDTTGRLFEQVTDKKDWEVARRQFTTAFGCDPTHIREHFKWSPRIVILTKRDGIPPCFAALYLSLLAASADDNTYAEGNFRKRFAALLQLDEGYSFDFDELPRLWAHVANWSRLRSEQPGGCARLLLPEPPQSERLIGHSKRLAFPTYKDEKHLRRVLVESNLDSESAFESVNHAVHSNLSPFSPGFREEAEIFNSLVSKAHNQAAYDSPFWGAVRDITWEEEDERARKYGRFCLQLDAADPQSPELFLLADEIGASAIGNHEKQRLPRPRGEYSFIVKGPRTLTSIDSLLSLASRHRGFAQSRVGRSLIAGGIDLFPDDLGNMASNGDHYDAGPATFMVCRDQAPALIEISQHLGLRFSEIGAATVLGDWKGFAFHSLNQYCLERVVASIPRLASLFTKKGWKPPQPRITGGARYGQAVLLNPASNPIIRLKDATAGRYQIFGAGRFEVAAGELTKDDEGFYIPPARLVGLDNLLACRYAMVAGPAGPDAREAILEVPVLSEVPSGALRPLQRDDWLVEGCAGVLEVAGEPATHGGRTGPRAIAATVRPVAGSWPLLQDAGDGFAKCTPAGLDAVTPPLEWLAEALSLRYQRRATLPFDELGTHLRMAAEASGTAAWKLRRLLFAANWLQVLEKRSAPFPVVVPAGRTISCVVEKTHVVARIVGMLTRHEQQGLLGKLSTGESASRLEAGGIEPSVGCVELQLSSVDRVSEIAGDLGLTLVGRNWMGNPLGGLLHPLTKIIKSSAPKSGVPVEVWDARKHEWIGGQVFNDGAPTGTLLRTMGKQRATYWAKARNCYLVTDSSAWAWMLMGIHLGVPLGKLARNGEVYWSSDLKSLPTDLCRWWLHWGGGCIAVGADGGLVFCGSRGRQVWEGIAFPATSQAATKLDMEPALLRRAMALRLRRAHLRQPLGTDSS